MIDIEKAHREFERYLDNFDCEDGKIKLKIVHTDGVVRCASDIARRMKLSKEDRQLAELIALLHDIGRFEQVRLYDSFEPVTMDHAAFGVQLLFDKKENEPMIRRFVASDEWDEIIRESIGRHSDYEVGDIADERTLLHARLIRDADKIDNCRVKLYDDIRILLGMDAQMAGEQSISDVIWETCQNHLSVKSADRVTKMDYWVSYIAYFFDINFKETYEIIREEKYVNRIIDRIPYSNPDTREKMEALKDMVNQYIQGKIDE